MLKRQRQMMLLVRMGLAISVCLNVFFFKWGLLAAVVDLSADVGSLLSPVTSWTVSTGAFEFIAAVLLVMASTKERVGVFFVTTRLLKYCFLMQLIVSVLGLIADGAASPIVISDICRVLAFISLLVSIDFDQDFRLTRDRAREARRAVLKNRVQKVAYTLERRELN